jgi:hypothetical protein
MRIPSKINLSILFEYLRLQNLFVSILSSIWKKNFLIYHYYLFKLILMKAKIIKYLSIKLYIWVKKILIVKNKESNCIV